MLIQFIAGCSGSKTEETTSKPVARALESTPSAIEIMPATAPSKSPASDISAHDQPDAKTERKDGQNTILDSISRANAELEKSKPVLSDHNSSYGSVLDEGDAKEAVVRAVKSRKRNINLSKLRYYENPITKKELLPLAGPDAVKYLRELDIACLGLTDDDLEPLSHLRLEELDISSNKICSLRAIENMDSLLHLNVIYLPLNEAAFKRISNFRHLKMLNLYGTPLKDRDLKLLGKLPELESLELASCDISYAALKTFIEDTHHKCKIISAGPNLQYDSSLSKWEEEIEHHSYDATERAILQSMRLWRKQSPPNYGSMWRGYTYLARCEAGRRRPAEALAAYVNANDVLVHHLHRHFSPWDGEDFSDQYIRYLEKMEKWDEALKLRLEREADAASQLSTVYSLTGGWQEHRAFNHVGLGRDYDHFHQFAKAADMYAKAVTELEPQSQYYALDIIRTIVSEGKAYMVAKDFRKSKACYQTAERLIKTAKNLPEETILDLKGKIARGLAESK